MIVALIVIAVVVALVYGWCWASADLINASRDPRTWGVDFDPDRDKDKRPS